MINSHLLYQLSYRGIESRILLSEATLVNIDMPKMSGFELIENIVKTNKNLKISVISGRADIKHENQKHVCFFIEKPFHPNQLREVTSSLMKCYFEGSDKVKFKCSTFGDREKFTPSDFQCPHKNTCNKYQSEKKRNLSFG